MKKQIKIVAILVAVMMIASIMAACGGTKGNDRQVSTETPSVKTSAETTPDNRPSYQKDTSPVTLTWYVDESWYDKKWNPEGCLFDKTVTDKTGVNLDIQVPATSDGQKISAMVAADDLPDILSFGWWYSQASVLQENKKVYALDELVAQYAPDMEKDIPASMKNWWTFKDGHWYGYPGMFTAQEYKDPDRTLQTNCGMVARKDIMDQLGIKAEDFNTQDGMVEALKKVKSAGLKTNGLDVIPLLISEDGGFGQTFGWNGSSMFAVPREDRNGNYLNPYKQPKWVELVKFGNRLFRDGYILFDNLTMDVNAVMEKINNAQPFCIWATTAFSPQFENAAKLDPKYEYVPVGPVRAADGAEPTLVSTSGAGWHLTFITKNCSKPDRAIRLLQYLNSHEGQMLNMFGVEGTTYTMENNRVVWTKEYQDALTADSAAADKKYGAGSFYMTQQVYYTSKWAPLPSTREATRISNIQDYFSKWTYLNLASDGIMPVAGTPELEVYNKFDVYFKKQAPKLLMAKSDADFQAIYSQMTAEMDKMGYDKVTEAQTQVLKENLAKLKTDHEWPGTRP